MGDTVGRSMLENSPSNKTTNLKLQQRLELCFDVYETAVQKLATPKMWQLYVETLFELNADENIKPKVQKQLNDVCKKAVSSRMLSDTHLIDWGRSMLENSPSTST